MILLLVQGQRNSNNSIRPKYQWSSHDCSVADGNFSKG